MKKALGQTVRDLKRGVNKKVLKVPGIEQKILDATSNEPWGPHGSVLADLAQATRNYQDYKMIMNVVWRRIHDTGKNWRHVYKALTVLEYLVAHGSDRIIDEIREHAHQISTLSNFQYVDSGGRDQGGNVRRKSQSLVALVNDREKLQEVRQKATSNKDKFQSPISASNASRPGYGDRYGNGYKDDDQNNNERERNYGYKDDEKNGRGRDSYSQDGDQYVRDHEERYGRDGYKDDDYQFESRGSVDRYTERSVDDDDRHSSRSGGGRGDDHSHDDRRPERHLYEEDDGAPPSYEESTKDIQSNSQNGRDGEAVAVPADRSSSGTAPKTSATTTSQDHVVSADSVATSNEEFNGFDEFDPRGSLSAQPSASNSDLDFFGSLAASDSTNSLALMLAPGTATSEADMPTNSGFGMDFTVPSAASTEWSQGDGNPFGDSPFKAIPQENVQSQSQNFAPADSFGSAEPFSTVAPHMETSLAFDFGNMLGGLTYPQHAANDQHSAFSVPEMPFGLASSDVLDGILPRTGSETLTSSHTSQPVAPTYMQTAMFPPQADPISSQAGQSVASNSMQAGHLTYLPQGAPMSTSLQSQPEVPNNMQSANLNFFQQLPSQGAPVSSQTAEFGTGNNMQLAQPEQFKFLQEPGISVLAPSPSLPPSFSSQAAHPVAPGNIQPTQLSPPQRPGESMSLPSQTVPTTAFAAPPKVQSTKFQPKSTVWADTLNRGLVDFNISGAKVNPLSDIGIDFDSINRMEKRKEVKSSTTPVTSTITMGKAMGAGSGIGRAGATGIAPPQNPMVGSSMGMGMGMGGGAAMGMTPGMGGGAAMGMTPGMGMGMGNAVMRMGMNQPPMGIGMAPGPGAQMWPPNGMPALGPAMPGVGYNPMMGMGNYGSQQSYGGAPQQQQFGGGYR